VIGIWTTAEGTILAVDPAPPEGSTPDCWYDGPLLDEVPRWKLRVVDGVLVELQGDALAAAEAARFDVFKQALVGEIEIVAQRRAGELVVTAANGDVLDMGGAQGEWLGLCWYALACEVFGFAWMAVPIDGHTVVDQAEMAELGRRAVLGALANRGAALQAKAAVAAATTEAEARAAADVYLLQTP
jgi:hypothetical protein